MNSKLFMFFLTISLFVACGSDNNTSQLENLENSFRQTPNIENGEALLTVYEAKLEATDVAEDKISLLKKTAITYYKMGVSEGLQASFTNLVQDFEGQETATTAAREVMDTLLYNITDTSSGRLKPVVATQYISLTETYAKSLPDAPESPELLYKSGEIARSIGDFQKALSIYKTVESYFPQYEKAPKALFMQAFTYAEDFKNETKARRLYEAFIAKYPEDDFVDDAQILLSTLGKSDEEIFQALEKE